MAVFHAGFFANGKSVRVRFGSGSRHNIKAELTPFEATRALVLTTPEQAAQGEEISKSLGELVVGQFSNATMHTPVEITDKAVSVAKASRADCIVAIGGGSTIGLGKAIAWRLGLPQIVLPTTYAGSEATPVLGQTENGKKTTFADQKVQPDAIVYDAELVTTLPVEMTVSSGLNAMAHAVEGLYAQNRTPLSTALAMEGIRAFVAGLPKVVEAPYDLEAREKSLFGAWLCGSVLAQVGMALHHKLCHTLGGTLGLPHAETHSIILPYATAYNEAAVADQLKPLADLLGADSAAVGLYRLSRKLGAPVALRELGVGQADLDKIANVAVQNPYWNPREIQEAALRRMLHESWEGIPPTVGAG